ncbi:MAG: helix-turn-helix transcriptional regulator [Clostridiales bacterium]|nr:helix-turn-helix transcriptional regulator [Clostridiales bacterium]
MSFGETVKSRRLSLNMYQEQIAGRMGITHQAVGNWEKGFSVPTPRHLAQLAEILDLDHAELTAMAEQAITWKTGGAGTKSASSRDKRREPRGSVDRIPVNGFGDWAKGILGRLFSK